MPPSEDPPSIWLLAEMVTDINLFWVFSFTAIAALLFSSALISGSEVAYFSLKPLDIEKYKSSGKRSEKAIAKLMAKPHLLLATILILNNLVNLSIVTISTFLMWDMAATQRPAETIVGVVTLITTIFITFFGEIVPKVYATRNYESWARLLSRFWLVLGRLLGPLAWPMMRLSRFVERWVERKGYRATVEELNQALELTIPGQATDEEKGILRGIVNFGTLTVRQVMKSRLDILAVDNNMSFPELLGWVDKSRYSRSPVYKETLDQIEGVLYIKDLLPHLHEGEDFNWHKLIRPGYFVPENKKLDSLLKDFQEKHVHMAIVVDEYGGTAGLVTLEDLLEEIVGEINDEFDEVDDAYHQLDEHNYIFEGKTSIHDMCKALDVEADFFDEVKGENESVGGLILELYHVLPAPGATVPYDGFLFTVLAVDDRRILKVKVTIKEKA